MASRNSDRLRRRLVRLTKTMRQQAAHRERLRQYVAATQTILAALERIGDATTHPSCLRFGDDAVTDLLKLGETRELQRRDAALLRVLSHGRQPEDLRREASRLAVRFAGRPPPDRGASLMDWYAWSVATTAPASADNARSAPERRGSPANEPH